MTKQEKQARANARTQSAVAVVADQQKNAILNAVTGPLEEFEAAVRAASIAKRKEFCRMEKADREAAGYSTGVVISVENRR